MKLETLERILGTRTHNARRKLFRVMNKIQRTMLKRNNLEIPTTSNNLRNLRMIRFTWLVADMKT